MMSNGITLRILAKFCYRRASRRGHGYRSTPEAAIVAWIASAPVGVRVKFP
jgi:hypothetical protein